MKSIKRIAVLLTAVCLAAVMTACGTQQTEQYETVRSFEFHFFKEEFDAQYCETVKEIELEDGADYQVQIQSECESGTIRMKAEYENEEGKEETVICHAPCEKTIAIDRKAGRTFVFTILIDSQTEGNIKVDFLSNKT